MALIDPKTAMKFIAIGQSIRDDHSAKPSLKYDGARKPITPIVIGGRKMSRHQRRKAAAKAR